MDYFLIFTTALVTTLLLVPPVKQLAQVAGVLDEPNERKVHQNVVPRLGGLAIFFGVLVTFAIYFSDLQKFKGIFTGMVIIVIVGLIDDTLGLQPRLKLLGQIVAALAAIVVSDINIDFLGGVLGSHLDLGLLSVPLTLFWIVGITNAINLSDGLDGLASGISLIAFACFGFLAYQRDDMVLFAVCLALIGSILGFLKYNTHPAEIFMGDTGSLFLGYSLGTLSLVGNFKSLTTVTLITPVLVLLVPITDTLWAIIRRLKEGRSPFSADKMHFHHRLMSYGMNHTESVSVIYFISAVLSICTVALANSSSLKYFLIPTLVLSIVLTLGQIGGFVDLTGPAKKATQTLDRMLSLKLQNLMANASLMLIQIGAVLYITAFALGLPWVPPNMLLISTFTIMLVLYLLITRSENGESFLIFTLFFLAAMVVVVTEHLLRRHHDFFGLPFQSIDTLVFWILVVGVFGKIVFRKSKELVLTTPLEFFIFLMLVAMAFVPKEIQLEFGLVRIILRSLILFLAFKIILLAKLRSRRPAMVLATTGVLFVIFGIVI
ncbi:MAG: undecaprenyl/decaprenyl-phosphate alpha-N-acetylglucosaminyl 1-phosphate transferase [Acidobacteria bacterium]|nr:undecaprenyl/decaprenyl-phosphate alpha-N-acetylglucosaminyl 1-phosphate transferase [Acidobacteriota bacterium]